jgi:4-hydroxy-tetrahydrodipicolinate synthase
VKAVLIVDPYYNGPSSLEISREYVEPLAHGFPEMEFIPYIIPGRTGTQLLPQDIALLHSTLSNLNNIKEATGDLERMAKTRTLCGEDFDILSGDDDKTFEMMTHNDIRASGVISVMSNVVPGAIGEMVKAIQDRNMAKANRMKDILDPLFKGGCYITNSLLLYILMEWKQQIRNKYGSCSKGHLLSEILYS